MDLDVEFDARIVRGTALVTLDRAFSGDLVLDTRDLKVENALASLDGRTFADARIEMGELDETLGTPLTIHLRSAATQIRIRYSTSPNASGLQWLEPVQTSGKMHPFLFTQSEATHARSWIPLQDTPQVRVTYSAHIRASTDLRVVMGAQRDSAVRVDGEYRFLMPFPIPSYLIALAVGDLDFQELSHRTGVYAERPLIDRAAHEFEDIEDMLHAAEDLFGPYRWGRYDVLVLPPSFPIGGMENPCLTFATPTILAGDKSLLSLVVHEMAHSWSSNIVCNATWRDFWLNEGLAVYIERRILEKLYGRQREEMDALLGMKELYKELSGAGSDQQVLYAGTDNRDPNVGLSQVPYEKGALFLRAVEGAFGRERFDSFLRGYLSDFAFRSITTAEFVSYLRKNLFDKYPEPTKRVPVEEWIYRPGIPLGAPRSDSDAFRRVDARLNVWVRGEIAARDIPDRAWTTEEWLHFLGSLPLLGEQKMRELDQEFKFTESSNAEILTQWLVLAVRNEYRPAYPRVEEFLATVGRRKYLKALYSELTTTSEGRQWALQIYREAAPVYHPISRVTVEKILRTSDPDLVGGAAVHD